SLNYLVGKGEQLVGNLEIELPCRFEVDHQLEFGRLNCRQVRRLFAAENTADVYSCLAVGIDLAGSVAHQSASISVYAIGIDCGYRVTSRQHRELLTLADEESIRNHPQRGNASFNERRKRRTQVSFDARIHGMDFPPQRVSSRLCMFRVRFGIGIARIDK